MPRLPEKSESKRKSNLVTIVTFLVVFVICWLAIRHFFPSQDNSDLKGAHGADSAGHTLISFPEIAKAEPVKKVDPKDDAWPTEVSHAAIKKQLQHWTESLLNKELIAQNDMVADSFSGQLLDENQLATVFDDGQLTVRRRKDAHSDVRVTSSFDEFVAPFVGTQDHSVLTRCAAKVVDIEASGSQSVTSVLVEMAHQSEASFQQSNSTWKCVWNTEASPPALSKISIDKFEIIRSKTAKPMFADLTATVLGDTADFGEHVMRDTRFWSQRLTGIDDMHIYGHHGISVADVNNDGLDDLYVCDSGGLPNRLYVQNADGTLQDASEPSNANWLEATASALLVDLDNDGDQDLVVASIAGIIFAANNGKGQFKIKNASQGVPEAHSCCAADYDNDGDLDLYFCNYGPSGSPGNARGFEASIPVPYNDANNGGANVLLQNRGNFQFADVTRQVGLDQNNRRFSFAAAWEDFDEDGDVDLYVANDFGRNSLYRNSGGRFEDVAKSAAVEDMAGGMSVDWADFNRDGHMDLYIGNMFSAAGNRVTYQRKFIDRYAGQSKGMQRMARGNTLFASNGNGTFTDVSELAGVTMGRWAWSSKFADLNNDGWQDLVIANGYFTNHSADDL